MGRPSRFDDEFRAHAVESVSVSRKPLSRVAEELGVSSTTLGKWMNKNKKTGLDAGEVLTVTERQELDLLRKEVRDLRMEREILKKATAFWVKEANR